jgi:hypothetical protein
VHRVRLLQCRRVRQSQRSGIAARASFVQLLEPTGFQPQSQILGRDDGLSTVARHWDGLGDDPGTVGRQIGRIQRFGLRETVSSRSQ